MASKVAVIGFDSVPPSFLFDRLLDRLTNFSRLYKQGLHGDLRTCDPPITVPAWMVMMAGKDPGRLGIYGFHHRSPVASAPPASRLDARALRRRHGQRAEEDRDLCPVEDEAVVQVPGGACGLEPPLHFDPDLFLSFQRNDVDLAPVLPVV